LGKFYIRFLFAYYRGRGIEADAVPTPSCLVIAKIRGRVERESSPFVRSPVSNTWLHYYQWVGTQHYFWTSVPEIAPDTTVGLDGLRLPGCDAY